MTQAADDLKARDAILRGFPEVWQVVGKAGPRRDATDPSPLDMVETIINLRDRELWPKRKLRFKDAAGPDRGRAEGAGSQGCPAARAAANRGAG